jgi:hypothetical protein
MHALWVRWSSGLLLPPARTHHACNDTVECRCIGQLGNATFGPARNCEDCKKQHCRGNSAHRRVTTQNAPLLTRPWTGPRGAASALRAARYRLQRLQQRRGALLLAQARSSAQCALQAGLPVAALSLCPAPASPGAVRPVGCAAQRLPDSGTEGWPDAAFAARSGQHADRPRRRGATGGCSVSRECPGGGRAGRGRAFQPGPLLAGV